MSIFPSFRQQELLVDGFCRICYEYTMPIMLIKFILSMYNEIFYWKFKGEKLEQFLATPNTQRLLSKPFQLKGIKFAYCLYPNAYGRNNGRNGYVRFGVCVLEMDPNIDYMVINTIIFCKECDTHSIHTSKLHEVTKKARTLVLMKSDYFTNMKEINFAIRIEIITIQPTDINKHKSLLFHKYGVTVSKKVHFEWNFADKLVAKIKSEFFVHSFRKSYPSQFFDNGNWSMDLYQLYMDENMYFFGFKIYQFPRNVKAIRFKYSIKFTCNDLSLFVTNKTSLWNYSNMHLSTGKTLHFDKDFISNAKSFRALIDIQIMQVLDMKDNEIQEIDWSKYNIV